MDPRRSSDVDFHDVFGGPPRRQSAIYDRRGIRGDSLDSRGTRLSDRPVFGDAVGSPARRRQLAGDFFSDIFPASDSGCSSPTREAWPASPGSRSPASLPAQISLSMKLAKGIGESPFSSPSHSVPQKRDASSDAFSIPSTQNNSMHSSLTRAAPSYDDSFYRQSPLSRQASHIMDEGSETAGSISLKKEHQKGNTSLEGFVNNNQFHFSIYKWAGKGVTLVIPSSTIQNKSRFRRSPEIVLHGADLSSYNAMPTASIASKSQSMNQEGELLDLMRDGNDDAVSTRVEEPFPVGSKKSLHIDATEESDAFERSQRAPGEWNSEGRNLQQLFDENRDGRGKEDVVNQVDETKNFSSGRKADYTNTDAKQQSARENIVNRGEVTNSSMEDIQVPLEQKVHGSRVKGKVRDFIKIFNYEASPKRKGMFETQDRRSKGKDGVKEKVETQVDTTSANMVEEMQASSSIPATSVVEEKSTTDTPIIINKYLKTEKYGSTKSSDVHMVDDPSLERKGTPGTFSESVPEIIDVSMPNADESRFEDLEGCVIEQLTEDENVQLQADLHQDQIKVSDAKIREWSKGKEENIRSLLSTLQYVLWPESGWKPVPLVNIIEGPSVKRAYQKALLYLHPDKLQQKGAAVHQKYIAEKVFTILQEAWDQFNSASSF